MSRAAAPFSVFLCCLVLAWFQGGFAPTGWGPVTFVLACLLGVTIWQGRSAPGSAAPAVTVMFASLACLVAWTFASIAWAGFEDDALVGAGKTLLYAVCFCLCATGQPRTLRRLFLGFGLGAAAIAAVTLYRVALSGDPGAFFVADRLSPPIDYENANVCLWMMAYCSLLYLGAGSGAGARVRAASLASMTLFLDISVLGESRAWFYLLPMVVIGALALSRERWRTLIALLVTGGAAAAAAPAFATVYRDGPQPGNVHHAAFLGTLVAVGAGLAGGAWALLDRRYPSVARDARLRIGGAVLVSAALILGIAGAFAREPRLAHPVSLVSSKWHDFKTPYEPTNPRASRFVVSLSNDRWREWTVAWRAFEAHPVAGVGADNYEAYYLRDRADPLFDPRYPHSIPLRLLSQLGLVGAALFVVFAACAVWRALALRRRDAVGGAVSATGLLVAGYWFLHGNFDWFWEIPALAAPAFAFLGAAARVGLAHGPARAGHRGRRALAVAVAASALLVVPSWLQAYLTDQATASSTPAADAYRDLRWAGKVNPLSADPYLVLGSIAINRGEETVGVAALRKAVHREPDGWYAYLQLATVAVQQGRFEEAERWVEKARRRNPKDPETALAQRLIRRRIAFPPSLLNDLYLAQLNHRFGASS